MAKFVEPMVEDKARGKIIHDIALIESEWPAHTPAGTSSGLCTPNSGSASLLLSVPSGKWFKPRILWVDNENPNAAHLMLYEGGSAGIASASLNGITVQGRDTAFIGMDCITVGKDLWVDCTVASCHVKVGGLLIASGAEN